MTFACKDLADGGVYKTNFTGESLPIVAEHLNLDPLDTLEVVWYAKHFKVGVKVVFNNGRGGKHFAWL